MAREYAFRRRQQRNASIEVQRTWRGCLGRRRSALERDKYLFSKAQSQGKLFFLKYLTLMVLVSNLIYNPCYT